MLIGYKLSWNQFSFAHPNQYELKSSPFAFVQKCGHGINLLKAMLSMRFVVHHPVKVDRKWRYCVRQPSTPHQMERSGLASRPGCFIPGKELPVPLERVAGTTWKNCRYHLKELPVPLEKEALSSLGPVCRLQRRGKSLPIPGIQPDHPAHSLVSMIPSIY